MRSWRWWVSWGAIPLWIAAIEAAWAIANVAACRRLTAAIDEARAAGVQLPSSPDDLAPETVIAGGPYVRACVRVGRPPEDADSVFRFAFHWDAEPERLWIPLIRGWVKRNAGALEQIRLGAASDTVMEIPPPSQPGRRVAVDYGFIMTIRRLTCLKLAFSAARLARIDGDAGSAARVEEAFRLVRLSADPEGPAGAGGNQVELAGPARVLRFLAESGDPVARSPRVLATLASLNPDAFRIRTRREDSEQAAARLILFANDTHRFAQYCHEVSVHPDDKPSDSPWHERLFKVESQLGTGAVPNPLLRFLLAEDIRDWLKDLEHGVRNSEYWGEDVIECEVWASILVASARILAVPKGAAPDPGAVFSGVPPRAAARLRLEPGPVLRAEARVPSSYLPGAPLDWTIRFGK